jgi:hypothetical protein
VEPLRELLDGTVVDGELVALDDQGRPTFNLLQNSTSEASRIHYFLFVTRIVERPSDPPERPATPAESRQVRQQ